MLVYLPEQIYLALLKNPDLTIKQIATIENRPYSSAARYRKKFKSLTCNDQVHHKINKTKIENWNKINHQLAQVTKVLTELLNSTGFESTDHLRKIYYEKFSKNNGSEFQSRRNFNRYFKTARENLNPSLFKLVISRSPINRIGFYTQTNLEYKPTDY